ncbi:hypothetical protein UlMin_028079 [Ulmus minor]
MALPNPISYLSQKHMWSILLEICFFLLLLTKAKSVSFNFTIFEPNTVKNLSFQGNAYFSRKALELTLNPTDGSIINSFGSIGRASYAKPVQLWDSNTHRLTDFTTTFSFTINAINGSTRSGEDYTVSGDGMTFFIVPFEPEIPQQLNLSTAAGGHLGLFRDDKTAAVAVEFDTYTNPWDPGYNATGEPNFPHVGIDDGSFISETFSLWNGTVNNGSLAHARVSYDSTSTVLSVYLTYDEDPVFIDEPILSYKVYLANILPATVRVGFSAATGLLTETHTIHYWSFHSSLEVEAPPPSLLAPRPSLIAPSPSERFEIINNREKKKGKLGLVIGLAVGLCILSCGLGFFWFIFRRRRSGKKQENEECDVSIEDEFERGVGPKRFSYSELSRATNNFVEEGKLGEGGFGGVYKGLLSECKTEVAVKRVSKGSKQGKKEYISEVKIISRLRHKNLVKLIGWCHENGEFLLVYEFMPNGSLDFHLFGEKLTLPWNERHKIAMGLASALFYLHDESEQCVVHRDIKSSNVLLDSEFNAKLGDFGLARLVDLELGMQTTALAGTMGYLAPECAISGKASKESDVYSFGVVSLEISCGRRPIVVNTEPTEARLIEWVWDLYGKSQLLEAIDKKISTEFYEEQIVSLMVVGLWCCHPEPTLRPTIKQVINVLSFETQLPKLPPKMAVPMYFPHPSDESLVSYSSSGTRGTSTVSSTSAGSSKPLLKE